MESPSSETVGNVPNRATYSTPVTQGGRDDATGHSLVHPDNAKECTPPSEADAEEYNMNHEKRGRAIIFNHEKYSVKGVEERPGTQKDKTYLKECFEKLKFDVKVYDDLPVTEIKRKLAKISKAGHKNEDCLVVVVLTHGGGISERKKENMLYAKDGTYETKTLWSSFTADVCPELAGKPKIFIIQACRGNGESHGVTVADNSDENKYHYFIPVEVDQLVVFSSYEGLVSYRNTADGTWFIQEFCKELEINGDKVDLLSLFTNVNRRVALYKEHQQKKQMPVVQSTLIRKIFFSSTTIPSRITITPDVTSLVEKTNKKLDYITEMFEGTRTSLSVSKVMPTIKHNSSLSSESLHSSEQTISHSVPQGNAVHKLAVTLKMFLEDEAHRLELTEKENGELILHLLSCWKNLNAE